MMKGIDVIIDKILSQAVEEADKIKNDARRKAQVIVENEEKKQAELAEKYERERIKASELLKERSEAASEQKSKQNLMQTKINLIEEIISESERRILSMESGEYFAAMKKLIVKYASKGKCEILFNKRDKERLPETFLAECRKECNNEQISIGEDDVEINAGFIIRSGYIEENFAISDVIEFRRDELEDMLNVFLKE